MRNVTFTSAWAGFSTIHLIDEKRKAQPFQMENFVTGVRGGEGAGGARRRRSRREPTKGARREEQAIDRKTSDRLAVRPSQLDRQAGPDVGEEVWRRRRRQRPWRSPRKRRRVSETLSGTDAPPPLDPARAFGRWPRSSPCPAPLARATLADPCLLFLVFQKLTFFFFPTSLLALRSKMKHLAHKQCDGAIRDFVQCSKEAGILVVIKCREHNKRMNECVSD